MGVRQSQEWRKIRNIVLKSHQGSCYLCRFPVDRGMKGDFAPEVDHIIPVSRGGAPFALENLAVTHKACNRIKGSLLPEEVIGKNLAKTAINKLLEAEVCGINWLEEEEESQNG